MPNLPVSGKFESQTAKIVAWRLVAETHLIEPKKCEA
jgi:hypothetical protein